MARGGSTSGNATLTIARLCPSPRDPGLEDSRNGSIGIESLLDVVGPEADGEGLEETVWLQ